MRKVTCSIALALVLAATTFISAQSPASNKAFFAKSVEEVTLGAISGTVDLQPDECDRQWRQGVEQFARRDQGVD